MRIVFLFVVTLFWFGCKTSQKVISTVEPIALDVGFYNVENLFDTIDNPLKRDDDFTPSGKNEYTSARYFKKIDQLVRVIEAMGFPAVLGVCEIENTAVLNDLAAHPKMKPFGYQSISYQSPDIRGIDNGLMYQSKHFKLKGSKALRIDFPNEIEPNYTTRDVLSVWGDLAGKPMHFIVNHFPSRRGGLEKSEPKRVYVAQQVKALVDSLQSIDQTVLVMGDFNDETDNKSILEILDAGGIHSKKELYNLFYEKDKAGEGSYNYKGNWNMLDQIMVSPACAEISNPIYASNPQIIREEWMMYQDKKHGARPSRTYGGPRYFGGFSDHLPVKITLKIVQ